MRDGMPAGRFTMRNCAPGPRIDMRCNCMKRAAKSIPAPLGTMSLPFVWIHVESADSFWGS